MKKVITTILIALTLIGMVTLDIVYAIEKETIGLSCFTLHFAELGSEQLEERIEKIKNEYNIDFVFNKDGFHFDNFVDYTLNEIKNENPKFSFIQANPTHFNELIQKQALYPLGDILPSDYFDKLPQPYKIYEDFVQWRGQIYGIPSFNHDPLRTGHIILWNKELFENEDLPSLYELQQEGEWTFTNMLEIAESVTRDTNYDGEIDQWGLYPGNIFFFLNSFGAELIKLDNNNQLQANVTDKRTNKFFESIQKLYEKDIIFPAGGNVVEAFNEGKIAMVAIGIRLLHVFELNEEIGIMYLPRSQEIRKHVVPVWPEVITSLSSTVNNPEIKLEIYHKIFKPKEDLSIFIEEKRDILINERDIELYEKMINNTQLANIYIMDSLGENAQRAMMLIKEKLEKIITGETPKEILAELNMGLQELIEESRDLKKY